MPNRPAEKKKLGLWSSASLIVGNMIGAGIFLVPAAMASFGSVGLIGWVMTAIGTFFLAKVFGDLSKLFPGVTGGPYAYTRIGLGDFAGFLIAWGYYLSVAGGNAAITVSFVSGLSTFFPIIASNPLIGFATGIGAVWLISYINLLGVEETGKIQVITTILKIVPLIVISVAGLFFIHSTNYHPFNSSGTSTFNAITAAATITMFSFIGTECAAVPAGEVENPEKTIPRATMLGLLIATIIYLLGSFTIMGMFPAGQLQHSPTPFADAADKIFGAASGARYWVSAGIAISAFGAINGWTLMQSQMPLAIAADKLFPPIFGRKNKKGVAWFGVVLNAVVVTLMIGMNYTAGLVNQFQFLLLISVLTTLIPYLFSASAYLIIRLRKKELGGRALAIFIGFMAFIYSLWTIYGAGKEAVFYGFILILAAIPFYIWMAYKKEA